MGVYLRILLLLAAAFAWLRSAIQTSTMRNTVISAYTGAATHAALYSTVPSGTAGTELAGGSPAYARRALAWGAPNGTASTVTPTAFDVPSGATVAGAGVHSAITAGNYLDGASVTSQAFASQGTYTLTLTYTQT